MKKQPFTPLPPDTDPKLLGLFTREKRFYKTFFRLLIVLSLQQCAAFAVNLVDNLMLGRYTELALSGATLVNQLQFALQQVTAGIGTGIVVLAAQYWGQKRTGPIKQIINIGLKSAFAVGFVFFLAAQLFPGSLLGLFTRDEAILAEAMAYLRIVSWSYAVFAVSNALMHALQAVETVIIGTVMSLSTIFINFCLNYCLIYGRFGAPELGVEGAAVATLVSRLVELTIILVYVLRVDKKLRTKARELLCIDLSYGRDFLRVATPIALSGLLWGVAQAAQTAILGHISGTVIAANSIASVIFLVFSVFGMSTASVCSVIMGKTIGEGRLHMIRSYTKTMQTIFILLGFTIGGLIFVCKDLFLSFYNVSPETKALAGTFLTILSVTTVGSCYEYPVESGIISGGGVTKYAAWVDNLFMWLFTIPSACLSAFVFHFPPAVTFCFLKADQILKCIPNAITCNRYRWVRILTRENTQ